MQMGLRYWTKGFQKAAGALVCLVFPSAGFLPKQGGHELSTWEKPSRSEPNVQALSLWSSRCCSWIALQKPTELCHCTGQRGECDMFDMAVSFLSEGSIQFLRSTLYFFYSFPGAPSGLTTPWKSSRIGEWSDAESPKCPNVFPDHWIVARHSSLPLALLKVLDQNRQDVAAKHSTFKTERIHSLVSLNSVGCMWLLIEQLKSFF